MKKNLNYYIGIDVGTNSVGYAVVDEKYQVIKITGKHFWGVRLFEKGEDAVERRTFRSQRRRLKRRKERINLLQDLTHCLVKEKDENFFKKLKQSYLLNVQPRKHGGDFDEEFGRVNIYNLFEGDYTDKDYYKEYPTIYHLRKALVEKDEKFDTRLVYLAMHNLIKYRGNFLYEDGEVENCGNGIGEGIIEFFNNLNEYYLESDEISSSVKITAETDKIKAILLDDKARKREKDEQLRKAITLDSTNKKVVEQIIKLFLGNECDVSVLFNVELDENLSSDDKKAFKLSFEKETFDENIAKIQSFFDEGCISMLVELKKTYDACKFQNILGENNKFLYQGMIAKYEKYGNDLKKFRKLLKESVKNQKFIEEYTSKVNEYSKYVAIKEKNGGYSVGVKRNITRTDNDVKTLKKIVNLCVDGVEKDEILLELDNGAFLRPLNCVENSVVPYQIQRKELEIIIDNQSKYYPYLREIKDKIISLLTFKRPYYVGVLKKDSNFSWIENEIQGRIYPWNFDELIEPEIDNIAEGFIKRMTNKCRFFPNEDVLPASSIICQAHNVLNEINTLKINGKPITVEEKKKIFNELFLKKRTVKIGDVAHLLNVWFNRNVTKEEISGLSDEKKFNSTMSSYLDMKNVFGGDFNDLDLYECIIEKLTVFSDKSMKLRALNKFNLSKSRIEKLLKLKYTKWASFSRKALNGVKDKDGRTVIEVMYEENKHFNAVIFDETLGFKEQFFNNSSIKENLIYDKIFDSQAYLSPAVKRAVWQTLCIVKEIKKVMGSAPSGIFIESTREDSVKTRQKTRLQNLRELYKNIQKDCEQYNAEIEKNLVGDEKEVNDKLQDDFAYLYVLQHGRCMYSGEKLDISKLHTDCEIDHVVPRCYIKDDSFDNRVLVKKEENQRKTSTLGIPMEIQTKRKAFWEFLKKSGLMSNKKYKNLTKTDYSENDLKGFVNRQLVETSQTVKFMGNVLKEFYPNTDVATIKAGLASQFRKCMTDQGKEEYYNFYKIRKLNDFHHAKDAYLTTVFGMFTNYAYPVWGNTDEAKYYKRRLAEVEGEKDVRTLVNKRYGLIIDKMLKGNVDDFVDKDGVVLWSDEYYNNMLKTMDYNDCIVTKKLEFWGESNFYGQNLKSSGKISQRYVTNNNGEIKPLPAEKYGGYSSEKNAYYVNATFSKGKNEKTVLVGIPTLISYKAKKDGDKIFEYVKAKLDNEGKKLIRISDRIIYKYQFINFDGQYCFVASDGEVQNATQLVVNKKFNKLLYYISKNTGEVKGELKKNQMELEPLISQFFVEYANKISKPYYKQFNEIANKLYSQLDKLNALSYEEKCNIIYKLLIITSSGAGRVDIKGNGYNIGTSLGRLSRKTLTPQTVDYYDVSATGLYKSQIKF